MRGAKNFETKSLLQARPIPLVIVAVAGVLVSLLMLRWHTTEGLRWYQVVYRLIYRLGLIIWRREAPPDELVALVEGPTALPAGRALDLGCGTGTGTDTIYLAKPRLGCHRR
jgi:SAM-dependent methyltransferase